MSPHTPNERARMAGSGPTPSSVETSVRWPRAVALWCLIIVIESANGALREFHLKPWLGEVLAEQLGFLAATLLIFFIAWLFAPWLGATSTRVQLRVGVLWAVLTLAFEAALAFGTGLSLDAFLADYDPSRGGLMSLGLAVLLIAPKAAARLRSARRLRDRSR